MNIVLLSGGSGKRLWPLSNEAMSKQFLKLLPGPDGEDESMVQRVYRQLSEVVPDVCITISTNHSQVGSLRRQLGEDVQIVNEPERRNTFPAILLACAHLYYEKSVSRDDVVVVLPIDVFAAENYFECLKQLEKELLRNKYGIMLMGARPTYPSEKYGYVVPEQYLQGQSMRVAQFKEKPELEDAKQLLAEGALWNCGVFAFQLGYVLDVLQRELPQSTCFANVYDNYDKLIKDSFDYVVVEKEARIGMIEHVGTWKDLGTWNTLTEEMGRTTVGKDVLVLENCQNTHVLNMIDVPIIAMGLSNCVVVASHDGILVSDKHESSYLKPYADQIDQRPMYEQRIWGDYRVLDYTVNENGDATLTKRMHIRPSGQISYQYHHIRTEVWTITKGEGIFYFNDKKRTVRRGEILQIPPLAKHAIQAITDMEFIEVQMGQGELEENDIIRVAENW